MKRHEQAVLLLRKAAQDEALPDEVTGSVKVADEVIGFHCQEAAEKMLKPLLSAAGGALRKTHDLGTLMEALAVADEPLPSELDSLDAFTPFASVYRYEDFDSDIAFDRLEARNTSAVLTRAWCDQRIEALRQ
jgi:HEPN domain-containing protein